MYRTTRKLLIATALSFGLFTAPAAMAERDHDRGSRGSESRHNDRDDHRRHDHDRGHERRYDRRDQRRDHRHDHQRDDRREVHIHQYWQGPRYHAPRYQAPRGHVHHHWRAGHRMPSAYRHHRYVVNDYRHYRLHQPPHGHHWVRVDNDVVLTAVATGVVAAVVYGIFQ